MTEQIRQPASIARILAVGAVTSGALLVIAALAAFAEPERAVRLFAAGPALIGGALALATSVLFLVVYRIALGRRNPRHRGTDPVGVHDSWSSVAGASLAATGFLAAFIWVSAHLQVDPALHPHRRHHRHHPPAPADLGRAGRADRT